jgi:hypothetical protein
MLVEEMPNARLLEANSIMELRTQPERLTNEIAGFLDEVWTAQRARGAEKGTKATLASKGRKRAATKRGTASKPASRKAPKAPAKRRAAAARA